LVLDVDRAVTSPASVARRIPIEAEAADDDGVNIHFLLHTEGGFLAELEVFREDSGPILVLPAPSALRIFCLDTVEADDPT
jgi:hypothetical protein